MSKLLMKRLMKELTFEFKNDVKFQVAAANALHETVEVMLINYFKSKWFHVINNVWVHL